MDRADFDFAPGIHLAVLGHRSVVDAFRREYAPLESAAPLDPSPLLVTFGPLASSGVAFSGGHKTVAWQVGVTEAERPAIGVTIGLSGAPRSFARSLVQGYLVEPMLSVLAAERGQVLLPGAGVVDAGGLILILGRSGAGKSTLMARLAATGHAVLGDDQVFVAADGQGRAFPRRLRFYPDIEWTAPEAYARLPGPLKRRLWLRRVFATASLGYIRPSLAVDPAAIGAAWVPGPASIARIVLLERGRAMDDLRAQATTTTVGVEWALGLLDQQRSRLELAGDAAWRGRIEAAREREHEILSHAFAARAIEQVSSPGDRSARGAVEAVARHLGLRI